MQDGRNDDKDLWHQVYFYYPEENQIIYGRTRTVEKGKATFAPVSINQGLTLGNWKEINKDFSQSENKERKQRFEERIFNKIKRTYSKALSNPKFQTVCIQCKNKN